LNELNLRHHSLGKMGWAKARQGCVSKLCRNGQRGSLERLEKKRSAKETERRRQRRLTRKPKETKALQ